MPRKIEVLKVIPGRDLGAFGPIEHSVIPGYVRELVYQTVAMDEHGCIAGGLQCMGERWLWRIAEEKLPKTNMPAGLLPQDPDCAGDVHFALQAHERVNLEPMHKKGRIGISYADTIPKCYHTPQGSFDVTSQNVTLRLVMPNDPSVWVNITLDRSGIMLVLQAMFAAEEK
jgi:hypothetical protein